MLSVSELLVHSTARIECQDADGSISTGSGFFFTFFRTEEREIPALVTNKHVVDGGIQTWIHLTLATDDYEPDYRNIIRLECTNWIPHPDPSVDLVICLLDAALKLADDQRKKIFFVSVNNDNLADGVLAAGLTAIEDVVVVGYPNGIWDQVNNLPIVKRGVTATPPFIDYSGKKEFLIDCAIYPGSSGSPVYLFNQGGYPAKNGGLTAGNRCYLLGIIYAGYHHTITGEIVIKSIPTANVPVPISTTPNNIGVCIKASKLLDFEPLLRALMENEKSRWRSWTVNYI